MNTLDSYLDRSFDVDLDDLAGRLPPPDESFVEIWRRWAREAQQGSRDQAWRVLRANLPQLAFPIEAGIQETGVYRSAVHSGVAIEAVEGRKTLVVPVPESISLHIHSSPAGHIPVIVARERRTFETLVQALAHRNEPISVPAAQGAVMIAGYNNWQRIHEHRDRWQRSSAASGDSWSAEFKRFTQKKENYQDRFLILSDGPYSGIPGNRLGVDENEWLETSLAIRRDHECAHYFTRRLFGSMKNHLLDELLADWAGMTGAIGSYRADWFLAFLGIERDRSIARIADGGRMPIYFETEDRDEDSITELCLLITHCAHNLERLEASAPVVNEPGKRALRLTALASFRLRELGAAGAVDRVLDREAKLSDEL